MPSLKAVAKHANTSVTTVSLVLSGRDGEHRISEATRWQVLESSRLLGYTPNLVARRLRSGTGAPPPPIGMLLPDDERMTITVRAVGTVRETLDAWAAERGVGAPDLLIEIYQGGGSKRSARRGRTPGPTGRSSSARCRRTIASCARPAR